MPDAPLIADSATAACRVTPPRYPPIGDYAIIGDGRTAALISKDGSIDWLCLPHFSGRSVFAAILDWRRGGRFRVRPAAPYTVERRYADATAVLETTFTTAGGRLRLTDLMPLHPDPSAEPLQPQRELLRCLEVVEGEVAVEVLYAPRPDYGRRTPRLRSRGRLGWACEFDSHLLNLQSEFALHPNADHSHLTASFMLSAGEQRQLALTYAEDDIAVFAPLGAAARERRDRTVSWWHGWAERCRFAGPFRSAVLRSALTLKLLTYTLSGAMVAAVTTSLPERTGGVRNWDYRFCWLRDAGMTLRALADLGYTSEGKAFLGWLLHATRLTAPRLQVLYDVYGEARVPESCLENLEGYRGSRPVRVGNGAWHQKQLDVYGEVVLSAYDYIQRGGRLDRFERGILAGIGRVVAEVWREPDQGLWESRGPARHHTQSKLMCWVALDRLMRLHRQGHLTVPLQRYAEEAAAIRDAIETEAFSARIGAYAGVFGSEQLDASLLLMPRYGFIDARSPRMRSTFDRIEETLADGPLVHRYRDFDDALPRGEGAFGVCSFWAVDYLARAGRVVEAEERMQALLRFGSDLGLFAEQIEPAGGEQAGNYPQAFSHLGIIIAAMSIAEARGETSYEE